MIAYGRCHGVFSCVVAGSFALFLAVPAAAQSATKPEPQIKAEDIVRTFTEPPTKPSSARRPCNHNEFIMTADGPVQRKCGTLGFNVGAVGTLINKPTAASKPRAAQGAAVAYLPPVQQRNVDLKLTFEVDSAELSPQSVSNLDQFMQALRDPKVSAYRFQIAGYTDMTGSRAHNLVLSQQRAESAVAYLTTHGVASSRLVAKGFGPTVMWQNDPKGQENRCVVARIAP
jgi:outer membrane protein OmpA-like peptidoglycan-associated protein